MKRDLVKDLYQRLSGPPLIQIIAGPREVGKTTVARSIESQWNGHTHYAAADVSPPPGPEWIETHWETARRSAESEETLLILDEVQKVRDWYEVVKAYWDDDRFHSRSIRVILVGSSAMLLTQDATDSLVGRFFLNRFPHWTFTDCRRAFDWDLDRWIFFGGYPGAASLVDKPDEWRACIMDSLVEAVISRDVLETRRISKPALMRHLFGLATQFPAEIVSYNKMRGLLQDAGNTTTLAHYLDTLETSYLISGLEKYSVGHARSRGSSPKLVIWNNALVSAPSLLSFEHARRTPYFWGRWVENAVGAHLVNHLQSASYEITYWRHRSQEVDYVVRSGEALWAIEVKSGRPGKRAGLAAFRREHPTSKTMSVGSGGMPLTTFFSEHPRDILRG